MGNLDPLLAGIKRLALNGLLLAVQSPPSIVLNIATGLSVAYNVVTGQYDLTCTVTPTTPSGTGTVTASASTASGVRHST